MIRRLQAAVIVPLAFSLLAGCSQPAPAPAKPTEAPKPAAPAAAPAPAAPVPAAPAASPAAPAAAAPSASPAAKPAAAVDNKVVEDFYKGKTVKIVVGSAPGGGYDTYARLVSRHLPRFIPGNPTVIVENQPGAGSLTAANAVYKSHAQDGTVVGHIQGGLFLQQLLGLPGVEFEAQKWRFMIFAAVEKPLCVVTKKSGFTSLEQAMGPNSRQLVVGGNAPGSSTWDTPMRLKSILGLNLKMVDGYDGTAKIRLAMDQGEVDGICGWGYESVRATGWESVKSGDYIVITQTYTEPLPELEKVPLTTSLAPTPEAKQLIELGIITPGKLLRPFVMSPNVPEERAAAMTRAFEATFADKEFQTDAERAKLELAPMTGAEGARLLQQLFSMPDAMKARLKQINEGKA